MIFSTLLISLATAAIGLVHTDVGCGSGSKESSDALCQKFFPSFTEGEKIWTSYCDTGPNSSGKCVRRFATPPPVKRAPPSSQPVWSPWTPSSQPVWSPWSPWTRTNPFGSPVPSNQPVKFLWGGRRRAAADSDNARLGKVKQKPLLETWDWNPDPSWTHEETLSDLEAWLDMRRDGGLGKCEGQQKCNFCCDCAWAGGGYHCLNRWGRRLEGESVADEQPALETESEPSTEDSRRRSWIRRPSTDLSYFVVKGRGTRCHSITDCWHGDSCQYFAGMRQCTYKQYNSFPGALGGVMGDRCEHDSDCNWGLECATSVKMCMPPSRDSWGGRRLDGDAGQAPEPELDDISQN